MQWWVLIFFSMLTCHQSWNLYATYYILIWVYMLLPSLPNFIFDNRTNRLATWNDELGNMFVNNIHYIAKFTPTSLQSCFILQLWSGQQSSNGHFLLGYVLNFSWNWWNKVKCFRAWNRPVWSKRWEGKGSNGSFLRQVLLCYQLGYPIGRYSICLHTRSSGTKLVLGFVFP